METVLVLGPSHYATLSNKCGLTPADQLETPCGELEVDVARRDTLLDGSHKSHFVSLSVDADEREHSLEMQFPFIKQVYPHAKVLPIMVGRLNDTTRGEIAASLLGCLPDLQMGRVAIVISSDFCHWGARFGYYGPASNSDEIRKLDMLGFDGLNAPSSVQFQDYLQRTGNTICGREAILLFLEMVERSALATTQWTLLGYSQSNTVSSPSDSSVSYLSASLSIIILK